MLPLLQALVLTKQRRGLVHVLNVTEGLNSVDPAEHISLFTDEGLARSILTGSLALLDLYLGIFLPDPT